MNWLSLAARSFGVGFRVALMLNMWQQQAEELKQNLTPLEKVLQTKLVLCLSCCIYKSMAFRKHERQLSTQTYRESWAMRLFLWLIPLWEHGPKLSYFKEKVHKLRHATDFWVLSWPSYVTCVLVYWIKRYAPGPKSWKVRPIWMYFRKTSFPCLPPHWTSISHGTRLAEFGLRPWGAQPSSLFAGWKNWGIQHSSCWSNYNGFTLTQSCSEQKLSKWKGLLQLPR